MRKGFLFTFIFVIIISIFPVFDLFINRGTPITFDGPIHISIIAQYSVALQNGDFPVVWLNNFANYGLPVGIFAQQLPIYIGALINLIINNPAISYYLVIFLGILFSNIAFYKFLRLYFSKTASLVGVTFLTFAPLRIIDIYIRGDLPEIFASMFLPLILIGIYKYLRQKNILGLFLIVISIALLTLSHPMMLLIYSFIYIPYFFLCLGISPMKVFLKTDITKITAFTASVIIGIGISGYYLIPLLTEIKYFYMGLPGQSNVTQYLSFANIFSEHWYYFYRQDIAPRGNFIFVGGLEILSLLLGFIYIFFSKQKNKKNLMIFFTLCGIALLFFTTSMSSIFYQHIKILSEIQFPWRMLAGFIFIPPIIYANIVDGIDNKIIPFVLVFIICSWRFPQLYGKNYVTYPNSYYYKSLKNLESVNLNTIWTGKTESYPARRAQGAIIEGKGDLTPVNIKNSSRIYALVAKTPVRIVDYTFYFPGWNAYLDNNKIPIQFQDPNFRGVITFSAPLGNHKVSVIFEDTKIRKLAKLITVVFGFLFVLLFFIRKRLNVLLV